MQVTQNLLATGAAGIIINDSYQTRAGQVLISTNAFETRLRAARLKADQAAVPAVLIARTDA